MRTTNKLKLSLVVTLLASLNAPALAARDPNQVNMYLVSDPHVDVTKHSTTEINPKPNFVNELDANSFEILIDKIGAQMDLNPGDNKPILILGDLPAHNSYSRKTTRNNINLAFEHIYSKTNPSPFFYIFGNNDSMQRNYGSFSYKGDSAYKLFKAATGSSDGFLSTGQHCPFKGIACINNENSDKGYYSAYLGSHLKLLSLNTVLFVSRPGFSPSRDGATEELQWLANELKLSKQNNDKVVLAMHVSPEQWERSYRDPFKKIVKSNPDLILAMLAAHTHYDEIHAIKVAKDKKTYVIPLIYNAGLGVDHGNASSFKTLKFIRSSAQSAWQLKNYTTYNFIGRHAYRSNLKKYYDFSQSYCANKPSQTVSDCLTSHINGNRFDKATSLLMSIHYLAGNPNNSKSFDPSYQWLSVY